MKRISMILSVLLTLCLTVGVLPTAIHAEGSLVYVSGSGSNDNDGSACDLAVSTMEKAYELVEDGGAIVICGNVSSSYTTFAAKNVTITNNDGTTTYTAEWSDLQYLNFQGNTTLKDLTLKTSSEGKGFIANGYDFTVDEGVVVNGGDIDDLYIIGGALGPDRDTITIKPGANITVKSGSKWVIYGAGQDRDGCGNTGDINISISGGDTQVKQLSAGFKSEGQENCDPDKIGNATINVTDGATIGQTQICGDYRKSDSVTQIEGSTITLNMGEGTTFGVVIVGSLFAYDDSNYGNTRPGQMVDISNVVINYYGATMTAGNNFYFGGAELGSDGGYPTERIGEATINFYVDLNDECDPILPGVAMAEPRSVLKTERARINIIENTEFRYADPGEPFRAPITRIVRFTDSGSEDNPQVNPPQYIPHILEFAHENDSDVEYPNVYKTDADFELNGISVDASPVHMLLVGDGVVPVITATDFVNGYRDLADTALPNTFNNDENGLITLSFLKPDGSTWQPPVDTVVFEVPLADNTGMTEDDIVAMFTMLDMDGYRLAYRDRDDGVLGQIIIKKEGALVYDANDNGDATGKTDDSQGLVGDFVEVSENGFSRTGYTFDSWNDQADGSGNTYDAGDKFDLADNDADGNNPNILYAQWIENTVSVNYVSESEDKGTVSNVIDKDIAVVTGTFTGSTATANEGYVFVKWVADDDDATEITDATLTKDLLVKDDDGLVLDGVTYTAVFNALPVIKEKDTNIPFGTPLTPELIASANDGEDGDLSGMMTIKDDGGYDPYKPGSYRVTVAVTDNDGNAVQRVITITVQSKPVSPSNNNNNVYVVPNTSASH